MLHILLVAAGGATGALSRYSLTNIIKFFFYESFYATFCINLIGSFLIGYLISLGYAKNYSDYFIKYFLIIGFLGSFTTFSAFSYEALDLLLSKKTFFSLLYILFSVVSCITAVYIGFNINKLWLRFLKLMKIKTSD